MRVVIKANFHEQVATVQGKQGIWKSIFPDRENTGNLPKILKIYCTQGMYDQQMDNLEIKKIMSL